MGWVRAAFSLMMAGEHKPLTTRWATRLVLKRPRQRTSTDTQLLPQLQAQHRELAVARELAAEAVDVWARQARPAEPAVPAGGVTPRARSRPKPRAAGIDDRDSPPAVRPQAGRPPHRRRSVRQRRGCEGGIARSSIDERQNSPSLRWRGVFLAATGIIPPSPKVRKIPQSLILGRAPGPH